MDSMRGSAPCPCGGRGSEGIFLSVLQAVDWNSLLRHAATRRATAPMDKRPRDATRPELPIRSSTMRHLGGMVTWAHAPELSAAARCRIARVVKLVDTEDLKSSGFNRPYRFDSGLGHHRRFPRFSALQKIWQPKALRVQAFLRDFPSLASKIWGAVKTPDLAAWRDTRGGSHRGVAQGRSWYLTHTSSHYTALESRAAKAPFPRAKGHHRRE